MRTLPIQKAGQSQIYHLRMGFHGRTATPEDCMAKFLPLFLQFLRSNPERVDAEIWGVSAQGFDFSDQEERKKRIIDDCGNQAKVITPDGKETHDLTRLLVLN